MKNNILSLVIIFTFLFWGCKTKSDQAIYDCPKSMQYDTAAVVSAHPLASAIGKQILQSGGNAVDAAIATQFALAVVYPRAGNIGGGGFMVVRMADGTTDALDYREKAPFGANRDMYLDTLGNPIDSLSREGHLAVGVPGTVDGMLKAHQKYGQLSSFKTIIQPAIDLANNGFRLSKSEAHRLNDYQDDFLEYNEANSTVFIQEKAWKAGDILVQKELGATLERIRDDGREGFYAGKTAELITDEMRDGKGIITLKDLDQYHAKWRTPIIEDYKNYKIISMPPPSSGGIALCQMLNILEDYPLAEYGFQSKEAVHLMVETERRVYADRAEHLGDEDFYPVPKDSLLEESYLEERMADFDPQKATLSDSILGGEFGVLPESFETTHTSVIDGAGNAVSVTTTLNLNYGSKVVVDGAGFFLNDEMDDFSAKPGVPNYFGLVGAEANSIAPEKRMLSSMTPTIIEKDGQLFMVLGAPGGSTIITAVLQTFLNVAEFEMTLDEAVQAPRFHHQWLPDQILVEEKAISSNTRNALEGMGHQFKERKYMAIIKAILQTKDKKLHAVGDQRNTDDTVAGY